MTRAPDQPYDPATELAQWARTRPDAVAIRASELATTYGELDLLVRRVSTTLRTNGLGADDRVLVLTRPVLVIYAFVHGASKIGTVTVPSNWRLSTGELRHVVADCGPALVVVDAVVAQETGSDGGPYWLGSGLQVESDVARNVLPYVRAAKRHGVPFTFSFDISFGIVHLGKCLGNLDEVCRAGGIELNVAVVESELSPDFVIEQIENGAATDAASDTPLLTPRLTTEQVRETSHIVALIGPEPVRAALRAGVDSVITGRALDIGLFMAVCQEAGILTLVAGHAGKLLECGGFALEPQDSANCMWARVTTSGVEVRSPNPAVRATPSSLVSHGFYERSHPLRRGKAGRDARPERGGVLRASRQRHLGEGAQWIDAPYITRVEGATQVGYRSICVLGVRDGTLLDQVRSWTSTAEEHTTARYEPEFSAGRVRLSTRVFGRDGVLGALERETAVTGYEAAVVANDQELANRIGYFIRLFVGPYPGRKTTAGNAASPYMSGVIPVGEVFPLGIYHLLPLADPVAPFPCQVRSFETAGPTVTHTKEEHIDAAKVIRSKNTGPFTLTIDIFFATAEDYGLTRASGLMTVAGAAGAYGVPIETVNGIYWHERVRAAKVSLLRWTSSADPFCQDMFGAPLHTLLASTQL